MDKEKVLFIDSAFTISKSIVNKDAMPTDPDGDAPQDNGDQSIYIEGYASTNDVDRAGDVVSTAVWETGLKNYLNNPIILANHDYEDPIGRMVDYKIDSKGLWIKARISPAAELYGLIKDGVVTAFSIGFKIVDAEYNSAAEVFVIKQIELMEISVVSVPCNQNTLFSLSKAFTSEEEFRKFKEAFADKQNSAKGLENADPATTQKSKEWNMDKDELQKMLADTAAKAAEEAERRLSERVAAEKAAAEAKARQEAELEARIKSAVEARISVEKSGAEKLLEEVTKRLEAETANSKKALEDLAGTIKEKTEELAKLQNSKMNFTDKGASKDANYADIEKAVLLGKVSGKGLNTKFGEQLREKIGQHMPSATWELEVSTHMEAEVRRRLVVAPLFRTIQMNTNVMTMPVNPEAGLANWVTNAQFGTTSSTGGTTATTGQTPGSGSPHTLKEITLNAYKVATNEYLAYEEEEDSLLVIMPIVRDAMVRRLARAVDRAYLLGAGSGSDPVKGVAIYNATSTVVPTNTSTASVANLRALRKGLGAWGLDPSEIVFVVSTEVYYDLLDDTTFQTMNQVGPMATLLTGQVGTIGNTPVLVSGEFPTKAGGAATASTNIGAVCFAPGNFLAGNQRGLRFDTQELVETQRRVLVGSLRTGMTQVTTNLGSGVQTLRWS
ncbi:Prohead protease [uncultured Caudovirales phage]|uniref:Prohead protease n=1 Tax=uncultured Caudovirales phage TaxID=2100421 RepID=A0A6J5LIS3_9CAUD|nr:Prohead protease [uncultured Caudovirales phage]